MIAMVVLQFIAAAELRCISGIAGKTTRPDDGLKLRRHWTKLSDVRIVWLLQIEIHVLI